MSYFGINIDITSRCRKTSNQESNPRCRTGATWRAQWLRLESSAAPTSSYGLAPGLVRVLCGRPLIHECCRKAIIEKLGGLVEECGSFKSKVLL